MPATDTRTYADGEVVTTVRTANAKHYVTTDAATLPGKRDFVTREGDPAYIAHTRGGAFVITVRLASSVERERNLPDEDLKVVWLA